MFNITAMINSFGKDFYKYVNDETLKKDLDLSKIIKSIGKVELAQNPEYINDGDKKQVNLTFEKGTMNIKSTDEEQVRTIDINCTFEDCYVVDFNFKADVNGVKFGGNGMNDYFELSDGKLYYFTGESKTAYKKLSGKTTIDSVDDIKECRIEPDGIIDIKIEDENFEEKIGSFIKEKLYQPNKTTTFSLYSFMNKITEKSIINEKEEREIYSIPFSPADYITEIYGSVELPVNPAEPSYTSNSYNEGNITILNLIGTQNENDKVKISFTDGTIDGNDTLEISIYTAEYKQNTTINIANGEMSFISRLMINCPTDGMADSEICSIIAGNANEARYYGKETIDIYSKLKKVAFKIEIAEDKDFAEYFIEPDEVLTFDPTKRLDLQLSSFVNEVFFKKELKKAESNTLALKKEEN